MEVFLLNLLYFVEKGPSRFCDLKSVIFFLHFLFRLQELGEKIRGPLLVRVGLVFGDILR